METMLQGHQDIDAVYTHDDDMAMGAVQAIRNANRQDEMFVTGAGGSKDAMNLIAEGDLYRATFLYNPSMSASAVSLAKLIAERKGPQRAGRARGPEPRRAARDHRDQGQRGLGAEPRATERAR